MKYRISTKTARTIWVHLYNRNGLCIEVMNYDKTSKGDTLIIFKHKTPTLKDTFDNVLPFSLQYFDGKELSKKAYNSSNIPLKYKQIITECLI